MNEPPTTGPAFASFAAFVESRRPALLRSAYLSCGDVHLAQDLVQGALVKLAQRWDRVSTGNPDGFARVVMYRDLISWRRKLRREYLGAHPDPDWPTSAGPGADRHRPPTEDADLRITLRSALERLTLRQRTVLVLRFYEDLSVDRTAELLGVSTGTVKSQTNAALRRLREHSPELADWFVAGTGTQVDPTDEEALS